MWRIILKFVAYVISIAAMAGFYDAIWNVRPDYFRVSADVNFLPIDLVEIARAYSAFSDARPLPAALRAPEDSGSKDIRALYEEAQKNSVQLVAKQQELSRAAQQDEQDYRTFEDSRFAQIEAYVAKAVASHQAEIARLDAQLKGMLDSAGVKSPSDLPPGAAAVSYSQLAVVRAQAAVQAAEAEFEARDYSLKHLIEFTHTPEQQAYLGRRDQLEQLRKDVFGIQDAIAKTRGRLYDAMVKYVRDVRPTLSYWDFLYFSVGAATTATFGDIAPNHKWVRLLVCFQVILSIIFVGVTINDIAGRGRATA